VVEGKDVIIFVPISKLRGAIFIEAFELSLVAVDPHENTVLHIKVSLEELPIGFLFLLSFTLSLWAVIFLCLMTLGVSERAWVRCRYQAYVFQSHEL
jgi:hypothetical protein